MSKARFPIDKHEQLDLDRLMSEREKTTRGLDQHRAEKKVRRDGGTDTARQKGRVGWIIIGLPRHIKKSQSERGRTHENLI